MNKKEGGDIVEVTKPEQLTSVYKKNGTFDKQRKLLLENFKTSETHSNLLMKLKILIDGKIKENPEILMKNKGKVGALIQGEIINEHLKDPSKSKVGSTLLSIVDKDIQEKIIDSPEFHKQLRDELKDVRRRLQGISDEDYQIQLNKEQEEIENRQKLVQEQKIAMGNESRNNHNYRMKNNMNRITKIPRFNFNRHQNSDSVANVTKSDPKSSDSDKEKQDEKPTKPPFMLY